MEYEMSIEQQYLPEFEPDQVIEGWGEEEDDIILFQYSITSYGADYPVESLVQRMKRDDIFIPHFQRDYVWSLRDASRFIETLLLGLPVPGIFLSKEQKTQKLLVIDGQQRLRTLQYFYDGIFVPTGREFSLRYVQPEYEGKTYKTLPDEDRRRIDDSIIHLTIVQQDEPSDDDSSIYHIFERLNTTGRPLSSQEIRACLYHGEFNDHLRELNSIDTWRELFGSVNRRMRDQELILRFIALFFMGDRYVKPMKGFLNKYMASNRYMELQSREEINSIFIPTVELILEAIGNRAFKPKRALNAAVFDSLMIGIANRIVRGPVADLNSLSEQFHRLMENELYLESWETATTDEENVRNRINLATEAFGAVE